jgi:hypothetical protein
MRLAEASQYPPRGESDGERGDAGLRGTPGEAARRALAEAEERRRAASPRPSEIGGRDGPDPVRYGDWEVNGLASDF